MSTATKERETVEETVEEITKTDAPETAKPERYAPEAEEISQRLAKTRKAGFTRPMFVKLTGLTYSAMWRAEHDRAHPHEVATLTEILNRVERGDFKIVKHGRGAAQAEEVRPTVSNVRGVNDKTGTVHLIKAQHHGKREAFVQRCLGGKNVPELAPVPDATELTCGRCQRIVEQENADAEGAVAAA